VDAEVVMKLLWLCMLGFGPIGCDSNPTPHPQADASYDTRADMMQPNGEGPDDNADGVPDCEAAGGAWDGVSCRNDVAAGDALDDTLPATPDVGDGSELGDGAEVDQDAGDSSVEGSDGAPDLDAGDSGPDASD